MVDRSNFFFDFGVTSISALLPSQTIEASRGSCNNYIISVFLFSLSFTRVLRAEEMHIGQSFRHILLI